MSTVDTDQEKALSIGGGIFRSHSVEEKKKEKEKRKKEFALQELMKAVLSAPSYKIECEVLGGSNPASLFIFGCLW